MSTAALSTIAKTQKQPKFPSVNESTKMCGVCVCVCVCVCVRERVCVSVCMYKLYTMEYYSAIK